MRIPLSTIRDHAIKLVLMIFGAMLCLEYLAFFASQVLGLQYAFFPKSWILLRLIIGDHIFTPFIIAIVIPLCLVLGVVGMLRRQRWGQVVLLLPVAVFISVSLGGLLYVLFTGQGLSQFSVFLFYRAIAMQRTTFWFYPCYFVGFFAGLTLVFLPLIRYVWSTPHDVHGYSRFATLLDFLILKLFWRSEESLLLGVWCGKRFYSSGFEHVLVVAPTGTGKSTSFAIPNIIDFKGSTVNNDMSMELYNKTAGYCRAVKKTDAFLFAPTQRHTHRWNPFHHLNTLDRAERFGEIQRQCESLISSHSKVGEAVWAPQARKLATGVILYLLDTQGYCNLGDFAELCCRADFDEWLQYECKHKKADIDSTFYVLAGSYLGIKAAETRGGIIFNLTATLSIYLDPIVRAATQTSDFSLKDLRKKPINIFVGIPDGELSRLSNLVTFFWEEASASMTAYRPDLTKEPWPVFFNIDECGNMNRLNNLRRNLNILRKFRVRAAVYFQYKDQSGDHYTDKEMKAFLNIKTKLFYTQSDVDDAEYVSRLFGKTTVSYKTTGSNTSRFDRTRSEHRVEKPLISADKIRRLPDNKVLINIDGQYGIKAEKCYYYSNKHYKHIHGYEVDYTTDPKVPNNEPIFPTLDISNTAEVEAYAKTKKKEKTENKKLQENKKNKKIALHIANEIVKISKENTSQKKSDEI